MFFISQGWYPVLMMIIVISFQRLVNGTFYNVYNPLKVLKKSKESSEFWALGMFRSELAN